MSWDVLGVYDQFQQLGLQNNTIYDRIPVMPAAMNNVTVNATTFEVECGLLPLATQSSDSDGFQLISELVPGGAAWKIDIAPGISVKTSVPRMSFFISLRTTTQWESF